MYLIFSLQLWGEKKFYFEYNKKVKKDTYLLQMVCTKYVTYELKIFQ